MYRCFNAVFCVLLLLPAVLFAQGRFMENFQNGNVDGTDLVVSARQRADLIIHNGPVFSGEDRSEIFEAVIIRGERIVALGGEDLVDRYTAERVIDLAGRLALPGFIDAHTHMRGRPRRWISLSKTTSIVQLQEQIREKAQQLGKGAWITGAGWSEDRLSDQRKPTRLDLDLAAPDNPVFLMREGGHSAVANSRALEIAGLDATSPDPDSGQLEHFEDGSLSGIIRERNDLVFDFIPQAPPDEVKADLVSRLQGQLHLGITSLTDASTSPRDFESIWQQVYQDQSNSPLPRATVQINSGFGREVMAKEALERLTAFGMKTGDGDERLKVGALKVFVDGGFTGPAAWTREPYRNDSDYFGSLSVSLDELKILSLAAHDAGWQLGFHAIGDAAIEETVAIFDAILRQSPREDHRHYVNHFTVLPSLATMDLMARQGIGIVQQPNFSYSLEDRYRAYLPEEKLRHNNAINTPLKRGIKMAFSSDVIPIGPLVGIYAAVTRRGASGEIYGADERIDVGKALQMYTANGAYMTFEENVKGQLAPGLLADIVILNENLLEIPPEKILETQVDMTILDGEIVYRRTGNRLAE